MIEGFKLTIKGSEAKKLIAANIARIKNKHALLKKQADAMKELAKEAAETAEPMPEEFSNVSNSPKFADARNRLREMASSIESLAFIHDHLEDEETYRVNSSEIGILGVGHDRYY